MLRLLELGYAGALGYLLLQPFQFDLPYGFHWVTDPPAVEFRVRGQLRSGEPTPKLAALAREPGSIEVWATPFTTLRDSRKAVIVLHGRSVWRANLGLAQQGTDLVVWRGSQAVLTVPGVFEEQVQRHVVATWDEAEIAAFVDGERVASAPLEAVVRWDSEAPLVLGSSPHRRFWWRGRLAGTAIYGRALEPGEIRAHAALGPRRTRDLPRESRAALLVRYDFSEGEGGVVRDSSRRWPPLELVRPQGSWIGAGRSGGQFERLANVILFVPLGLLFAMYSRRGPFGAFVLATLGGGALSLAFESAQYFEPTRVSTAVDVLLNTLGAALGAALFALGRTLPRINAWTH